LLTGDENRTGFSTRKFKPFEIVGTEKLKEIPEITVHAILLEHDPSPVV
jgi:hypothetical protein